MQNALGKRRLRPQRTPRGPGAAPWRWVWWEHWPLFLRGRWGGSSSQGGRAGGCTSGFPRGAEVASGSLGSPGGVPRARKWRHPSPPRQERRGRRETGRGPNKAGAEGPRADAAAGAQNGARPLCRGGGRWDARPGGREAASACGKDSGDSPAGRDIRLREGAAHLQPQCLVDSQAGPVPGRASRRQGPGSFSLGGAGPGNGVSGALQYQVLPSAAILGVWRSGHLDTLASGPAPPLSPLPQHPPPPTSVPRLFWGPQDQWGMWGLRCRGSEAEDGRLGG